MKKSLVLILLAVLGVSLFAQKNGTSRKRYALVIGNEKYSDYPLSSNVADAQAVAAALTEKEFDVTLKKNLTDTEFKAVLNEFVDKVNRDFHCVSLVYYTGHAFTESEKNYLLPVNNDKFHSPDAAKKYGFDLQADVADRIKTEAQIYIIDGAYDNPFKVEGTRAIGIKGGLSASRVAKESTVGFLFSASPNTTVLTPSGKNSVFATAVVNEINTSTKNLSATFNAIKDSVSSATKNEQIPYSSATSLEFAFNGDELTALKAAKALEAADSASLESFALKKSYETEQTELNILKSGLSSQSEAEVLRLSQEALEQRRRQQEEDRQRASEEALMAAQRSAADNAVISARRAEFEARASALSGSMKKDSTVEDRLDYIEQMKTNLYDLRQVAQKQIEENNEIIDEQTEGKIEDIWSAKLQITEKDSYGNMTASANARRQKKVDVVKTEAEAAKASYAAAKNRQIAQDNKKWLPQIGTAYSKLESSTYSVTSLSDALTVRVGNYDGSTGTWNLHITSELFGYTSLFTQDIPLSYTDVTGKKNTDITKMNDAQMAAYNDDVMIFDSLFRSATPVFYVKLSYKIMRWKEASEYHFVPVKCEVIRLGKKNKTIHTVKTAEMNSANFILYPQVEIRTLAERSEDYEKATKILAAENKRKPQPKVEKPAKQEYSSSYDSYYSDNSYDKEEKKEKSEKLHGRNGLYFSGNYVQADMFENNVFPETMAKKYGDQKGMGGSVSLAFSQGGLFYTELTGGLTKIKFGDFYDECPKEVQKELDKNVYYGKLSEGLSLNFGNRVRPFVYGVASFMASPYNFINLGDKDKLIGLHAGGGFDFIFDKHLMLTFGADYGWMHFWNSFKEGVDVKEKGTTVHKTGKLDVLKHPDFHMIDFNIGFGFTW